MGEAGIGKSRLLHEFRHAIDGDQAGVLEGRCQASGENTPYLPFVNALRQEFQAGVKDLPEIQLRQSLAAIREIDSELEPYIPLYLHLLSIPTGDFPLAAHLTGEDLRAAIQEALGAVITLKTRRKPLVFILEDWHWADEASDATLKHLLGLVAKISLLLVITLRPEYVGGWPPLSSHTSLTLQPMPDKLAIEVVKSALGAGKLPERLGEMIRERTGGNPFFIEEMCTHLLEEGVVQIEDAQAVLARPNDELSLPDTVQAVIRSRLDRLDSASRGVLQWASVIGREFDREVLTRAMRSDPTEKLEKLKKQEVIRQHRALPEPGYQFNHALTQQVVYQTLLLKRRAVLHRQVANAIEGLHADQLNEQVEALAGHFELGEVWEKAFGYHLQAGKKAKRNHLMKTALHHLDRAKNILDDREPDIPWRLHFDLLFERKEALGEIAQWDRAYRELGTATEIADREGDHGLKVRAMFARANAAFWGQLFNEAIEELAKLEKLVAGDQDQMLGVTGLRAFVSFMMDDVKTALAEEKEATALLAAAPDSRHWQMTLWYLGVFHRWRGDHRKSVAVFEQLMLMQKDTVGIQGETRNLVHYCMALVEQGKFQQAIRFLEELREAAVRTDSMYSVLRLNNTLGWALGEIFSLEKAIRFNEMALVSRDELRGPRHDVLLEIDSFARLNLADIHLLRGDLTRAAEFLETTYENAQNPAYSQARPRWKPRCLIAMGELWLARGEIGKSEAFLVELDAHGFTDGFPFRKHQVRARRLKGALFSAKGQAREAEAEFKQALDLALELENPTQIWQTHRVLGRFYAEQGRSGEAAREFQAALGVMQGIAEGLTDPVLKDGFLGSQPFREVFAQMEKG
ncbi:MAG: AAA family ATPase [SAR324 cluster bacterium]|nr:AAA family ATPase [SAR324 cluster bacterium]